jgi:hypothetical protein
MQRRSRWGWFAGGTVVLLLALASTANAYVQGVDAHLGRGLDATPDGTIPQQTAQIGSASVLSGDRGPYAMPIEHAVTEPVPEPGTLTLASLGLLALAAVGRARRRFRAPGHSEVL